MKAFLLAGAITLLVQSAFASKELDQHLIETELDAIGMDYDSIRMFRSHGNRIEDAMKNIGTLGRYSIISYVVLLTKGQVLTKCNATVNERHIIVSSCQLSNLSDGSSLLVFKKR